MLIAHLTSSFKYFSNLFQKEDQIRAENLIVAKRLIEDKIFVWNLFHLLAHSDMPGLAKLFDIPKGTDFLPRDPLFIRGTTVAGRKP